MSHYEFKPSKKKGRNEYVGSWSETAPKVIDLPFTVKSLITTLTWGATPNESKYSHQDIAHWCDQFHMSKFDMDTDKALDIATGIAADVDAQWDMYLANSFTLEELKKLDFSKVNMPIEWFRNWILQIENV